VIRRPFRVASPWNAGDDWIRGDVRFAEGPAPRTALVVVHGFKGFKDFGPFPYLCEQLARKGHAVVSFNFSCCGIGEQPKEFTELEAFARNTYTRELAELRHVVDMIVDGDLLPRRVDHIGLVGHSRGGGSSVIHASEDERIDGLVTWGAISNFDRWTDETLADWRRDGRVHVLNGRTGQHMPLDLTLLEDFEANRDRLDIRAAAGRVTQPWLVLHGADDLTVGLRDAEALVAANGSARLVVIEEAGHVFEARHPFESVPPQLDEAIALTADHFRLEWKLD
jgi:uncharacterized protein